MARPSKNSCDYFPHDAGMRNHRKIKAIRTKYKLEGYAIWNMLLEYLTGIDGNEFENSATEKELIAGDFGVSVTEISDIIDYCIYLELLFERNGFIYSESLDENLLPVYQKRKVAKSLSKKQLRMNGKFCNNNTDASGVSVTEIPQSKVDKIKVDKIKKNSDYILNKNSKSTEPNIPTYQQVLESFIGQGGTEEQATAFFNKYEGIGWMYSGNPITNFTTIASNFITNWKTFDKNNSENGTKSNNSGAKLGTSEARIKTAREW